MTYFEASSKKQSGNSQLRPALEILRQYELIEIFRKILRNDDDIESEDDELDSFSISSTDSNTQTCVYLSKSIEKLEIYDCIYSVKDRFQFQVSMLPYENLSNTDSDLGENDLIGIETGSEKIVFIIEELKATNDIPIIRSFITKIFQNYFAGEENYEKLRLYFIVIPGESHEFLYYCAKHSFQIKSKNGAPLQFEDEQLGQKVPLHKRYTLSCVKKTSQTFPIHVFDFPLGNLSCSDSDLITFQHYNSWKLSKLYADSRQNWKIAQFLLKLDKLCNDGTWESVQWKGEAANRVVELMNQQGNVSSSKIYKDYAGDQKYSSEPLEVEQLYPAKQSYSLIILDRDIDLYSLFLVGQTYECMIEEFFGMEAFSTGTTANSEDEIDHKLKCQDYIFSEIRDMHIEVLTKKLHSIGNDIYSKLEYRKKLETIHEIKAFTELIPELHKNKQSLAYHLDLVQKIRKLTLQRDFMKWVEVELNIWKSKDWNSSKKYILECIYRNESLEKVLRLLVQASLSNRSAKLPFGGLTLDDYNSFRSEMVDVYGIQIIRIFQDLEKANLLQPIDYDSPKTGIESPLTIQNANSKFNIEKTPQGKHPNPDIEDPPTVDFDIHRIYYGNRCPLLIQVLNRMTAEPQLVDSLKLIPGPYGKENKNPNDLAHENSQLKKAIVVVIGGVTISEMNAIRGLNRMNRYLLDEAISNNQPIPANCFEYVVLTSEVITGKKLLQSFFDQID